MSIVAADTADGEYTPSGSSRGRKRILVHAAVAELEVPMGHSSSYTDGGRGDSARWSDRSSICCPGGVGGDAARPRSAPDATEIESAIPFLLCPSIVLAKRWGDAGGADPFVRDSRRPLLNTWYLVQVWRHTRAQVHDLK